MPADICVSVRWFPDSHPPRVEKKVHGREGGDSAEGKSLPFPRLFIHGKTNWDKNRDECQITLNPVD